MALSVSAMSLAAQSLPLSLVVVRSRLNGPRVSPLPKPRWLACSLLLPGVSSCLLACLSTFTLMLCFRYARPPLSGSAQLLDRSPPCCAHWRASLSSRVRSPGYMLRHTLGILGMNWWMWSLALPGTAFSHRSPPLRSLLWLATSFALCGPGSRPRRQTLLHSTRLVMAVCLLLTLSCRVRSGWRPRSRHSSFPPRMTQGLWSAYVCGFALPTYARWGGTLALASRASAGARCLGASAP